MTGKVYAADYTDPTPATLTAAVSDMARAIHCAAGRTNPDATELGAGEIARASSSAGCFYVVESGLRLLH